jgi:signal transduction histidine kinase
LRTPLNAINGITIYYWRSLKISCISIFTKIFRKYLTTFINEILEINKIESNKVEVENINFNLKQLLIDIQNSLKGSHENNNSFILEIDPNIPDNLTGDPTKLSQI